MNTHRPENNTYHESMSAHRKMALGIVAGITATAALVLGGEAAAGQLYADDQTIAVDALTILGAGTGVGVTSADILNKRSEAVRQRSSDREQAN